MRMAADHREGEDLGCFSQRIFIAAMRGRVEPQVTRFLAAVRIIGLG